MSSRETAKPDGMDASQSGEQQSNGATAGIIVRAGKVTAKVPDGGVWGWLVCSSCFMGNFLMGGILTAFGIILQSLKEHYNQSTASISLVCATTICLTNSLGPLVAVLVNRYGVLCHYVKWGMLLVNGNMFIRIDCTCFQTKSNV